MINFYCKECGEDLEYEIGDKGKERDGTPWVNYEIDRCSKCDTEEMKILKEEYDKLTNRMDVYSKIKVKITPQ